MPRFANSNRPDTLRDRAGERALFVAEQFAFEQSGWNRRAVQFDECFFAATAQLVDRTHDEFFTGARLA